MSTTKISQKFTSLNHQVSGINDWKNYRGKTFTIAQLKAWKNQINWPLVFEFKCWEPSLEFFTECKDSFNWNDPNLYKPKLHRTIIQNFSKRINWNLMAANQKLTDDIISEFAEELDWNLICKHQKVSDKTMRQFADKINWNLVIPNRGNMKKNGRTITQKLLKDQGKANRLDWSLVCRHQYISFDVMKEFEDKMDWVKVSRYQPLDEPRFFDRWADKLQWTTICQTHKNLPSDVLKKYFDKMDWKSYLTQKETKDGYMEPAGNIETEVLENLADKFDWTLLSQKFMFDDDQIRKFKDRVDWDELSGRVDLDPDAKKAKSKYFKGGYLKSRLSDNILDEFGDKVNWDKLIPLLKGSGVNEGILLKYQDRVNWNLAVQHIYSISASTLLAIGQKIDWKSLDPYSRTRIPAKVLLQFGHQINWNNVKIYNYNTTEITSEVIEKFADQMNWEYLVRGRSIDMKILDKYADRVDWDRVSGTHMLSEEMIRKYADRLNWKKVSRNQHLTVSLYKEFKDRIDMEGLKHNYKCTGLIKFIK